MIQVKIIVKSKFKGLTSKPFHNLKAFSYPLSSPNVGGYNHSTP